MTNIRTYSELSQLKTFKERFDYLKIDGTVGFETFGFDRYLNQIFYRSPEWRMTRRDAILRDEGCDLGILDRPIFGPIYIHHMIPITKEDILNRNPIIYDLEYLICTSYPTHEAIHFSDESILVQDPIIRKPNDTCPWR